MPITIYINKNIIIILLIIMSIGIGYLIGKIIWSKKLINLVNSLPEGNTLFLGDLDEEHQKEITKLIEDYCNENKVYVAFMHYDDIKVEE